MSLSKELKKQIADYFEAADLVDFLQIKVEDIIEDYEDTIETNLDDVLEMIGLRSVEDD